MKAAHYCCHSRSQIRISPELSKPAYGACAVLAGLRQSIGAKRQCWCAQQNKKPQKIGKETFK